MTRTDVVVSASVVGLAVLLLILLGLWLYRRNRGGRW